MLEQSSPLAMDPLAAPLALRGTTRKCGRRRAIVRGIKIGLRCGAVSEPARPGAEVGVGRPLAGALERARNRMRRGASASGVRCVRFGGRPAHPRPGTRPSRLFFAESRSPRSRAVSERASGQPVGTALERRGGQDAPWRIRVRSAVRPLRREACPPPPRHPSLTAILRGIKIAAIPRCLRTALGSLSGGHWNAAEDRMRRGASAPGARCVRFRTEVRSAPALRERSRLTRY